MGLLDSIEAMASSQMSQGNNSSGKVAGGLLSALDEHPGGLGGLMNTMQQNGVNTQSVATGQATSPDQIQQGLGGSGIIDKIAARTGLSETEVKLGLATALPLVMAHFTQGGTTAPPQSGFGGMASQILGKFI